MRCRDFLLLEIAKKRRTGNVNLSLAFLFTTVYEQRPE